MDAGARNRPWLCLLACTALACVPSTPPPGVVRFDPRNFPESVEGPMPHFGPFNSRMDALLAACPLILTKPRATAGRRDDPNFGVRWRASTEYCAWLYYTPDRTYDMSLLVESTEAVPLDNQGERRCRAPAFVSDPRYPKHSLKYLYFLHNHPAVPTNISERDIRAVIKTAMIHGKFVDTEEGRIPIGVIAFIANTYEPSPHSCDGFYEYRWGSSEVMKWQSDAQGLWLAEKAGSVTWINETEFTFEPSR
ncbi:hypothetical protein [Hyalangium gracile]|uniref:hypothetical protein n=1 Tax=Hyalangium gracile TaxID=394092 RepID=UPI001CCB3FD1|nr:hypothetical protein [Hyalangium gracile]